MKRNFLSGLIGCAAWLLSSCGPTPTRPPTTIPLATSTPVANPWIKIQSVSLVNNEAITFTGAAVLPENACIETDLIEDGVSRPGWPTLQCADILTPDVGQGRNWELTVPHPISNAFGQATSTPIHLPTSAKYVLKAWWRDNPSVKAELEFNLDGSADATEAPTCTGGTCTTSTP